MFFSITIGFVAITTNVPCCGSTLLRQGLPNEEPPSEHGVLIFYYKDNTQTFKILYGSSNTGEIINIPNEFLRLELDRIEVRHGSFMFYSRKDGRGASMFLDSIYGVRELAKEEIGFTVKSVRSVVQ